MERVRGSTEPDAPRIVTLPPESYLLRCPVLLLATLAALAAPAEPWPGIPTELSVIPVGGTAGADNLGSRGAWVVARPLIDGIPVEIAARSRLDRQGLTRREWLPALPATHARGTVIDRVTVVNTALRRFPGTKATAALTWIPVSGVLRRFWIVDVVPEVPMRGYVRPRMTLDAETGAIVAVEERSIFAAPRGYAYRYNPIVDTDLEDVPLAGAADELANELMAVRQCSDVGEIVDVDAPTGTWPVHVCTIASPASPVDGNYYFDPVPWAVDPASDEDEFVASHVFWNVRRGLDWFSDHGWEPQPGFDRYLWITVNQRYPNYWSVDVLSDPRGALAPYDNAFYSFEPRGLVFGQGASADFGYDADVVMHELGHFIVDSRGGPHSSVPDAYGFPVDGGALNEAFADYFSCAIQGDPVPGEYVFSDGTYGRNLSGSLTCADRYGEAHYDGEPFAQALWTFRMTLVDESERDTFDQALLDSLTGIGEYATFAGAVSVIVSEVGDVMGAAAAEVLAHEFSARGFDDCVPIVDVAMPGPIVFRSFTWVPAWFDAWLTPVPGRLQFRADIPDGGATLVLRGTQSEYRGLDLWEENEPKDLGIVGRSGDSLKWEWEESPPTVVPAGYLWTHDGETVATFARTYTSEDRSDPVHYFTHTYEARWTVREAGPFVFQFTNDAGRDAKISDLALSVVPLERSGCGCSAYREPLLSPLILVCVSVVRRRALRSPARRRGAGDGPF